MNFGQPLVNVKGALTLRPYLPTVRPDATGALRVGGPSSDRIPRESALRFVTLGMSVVGSTSALDVERMLVVSLMLKPHHRPVAAMFASAPTARAKYHLARSAAKECLKGSDLIMFDALMERVLTLEEHRNKLAHYIWAHADELPDRLVLLYPTPFMAHVAQGRPTKRFIAYPLGWTGVFQVVRRPPDISALERTKSWSYSEKDLDLLIGTCEVTMDHLQSLGMLLAREPGYERARASLSFLLPDHPKKTPGPKARLPKRLPPEHPGDEA